MRNKEIIRHTAGDRHLGLWRCAQCFSTQVPRCVSTAVLSWESQSDVSGARRLHTAPYRTNTPNLLGWLHELLRWSYGAPIPSRPPSKGQKPDSFLTWPSSSCVAERVLVLQPGVRPEPLRWESRVQDNGPPEIGQHHVISVDESSPRDLHLNVKTQLQSMTSKLQCWTPHAKQLARQEHNPTH